MQQLKPTRTVYTVSEFLDRQRNGSLKLKPIFQRREVWGVKAKSLLIDTVVKGLPIPIVFLRKAQDLQSLTSVMEVVDGQQRLRTLLSFIDPECLSDFKKERDEFTVFAAHNPDIADKPFKKLSPKIREDILGYEISTHILQPSTEDELVLRIFARLNSTGSGLNAQELRNAKYFGAFKVVSLELAVQSLNYWRKWRVFSEDDLARMIEVESTSDYMLAMMRGVQGKSQPKLDKLYEEFDDKLPGTELLESRFHRVLEAIDLAFGEHLSRSRVRRQALFYSLFSATYDHMYGLAKKYLKKRKPRSLPASVTKRFRAMNARIESGKLPEDILDAMERATADTGRRQKRHQFFMESLGLVAAS